MTSYNEWIDVMVAVKAATAGSEEGFAIFDEWSSQSGVYDPETTRQKWDSFRPPYHRGWPHLAQMAQEKSGGAFSSADEDFEPVETPPGEMTIEDQMFARYVWVEQVGAVVDMDDKSILDRQVFNARNWMIGDPADNKKCAWAVFLRNGDRRRTTRGLTYRPGKPAIYREAEGDCANIWRAPVPIAEGPSSSADAARWLDHLAYAIPNVEERETLLNWFAWVVQNPAVKPNWGVLLGGGHGLGKSYMLEPLRRALGPQNVREVKPEQIGSDYNGWLAETKLLIVEEMHSFERKETMQRLKSLLAAPPHTLQINPKFGKQFEIPNILAGVFFTNHENALALETGDRRFYVLWSDAEPLDDDYYDALLAWYAKGGTEIAARWLMERDLKGFDARGRAPMTEAKEAMRRVSLPGVEEWIEDGIRHEEGVFATTVAFVEEIRRSIPEHLLGRRGRPTASQMGTMLKHAKCRPLGQIRVGDLPGLPFQIDRTSVVSLRRHEMCADLPPEKLRQLWRDERARLEEKRGKENIL